MKKQGICGDKNFGFYWEETYRTEDNNFVYGKFYIIVNNVQILNNEFEYDINFICYNLKETILTIKEKGITLSNEDRVILFLNALKSRNYYIHPKLENKKKWIKTNLNDDFGIELNLYDEITDEGWRFFLFRTENQERLIYSNNHGKTVSEVRLPLGTVEKVTAQLPDL